jgi:eukaryotic-like serine/threonine-protein kinase
MRFVAPANTDLVRLLGGGSVFEVGLVRTGGHLLACKRLLPHALSSPAGRAAMVREARLLALVKHPALPRLIDVGSDAAGPFFLETFVEGASTRVITEGWREEGRPMPPTLFKHIASLALEALAEIHEIEDDAGPLAVSHGDITPDHVILSPIGGVHFIDLGAARFRGMEPELETDDRGTLPYTPPEIARGEARPGPQADVYALAATLLFCAHGGPLCAAAGEAAMLAEIGARGLRTELIEEAPALRRHERDALRAALDPDPARRPPSARALLAFFQK